MEGVTEAVVEVIEMTLEETVANETIYLIEETLKYKILNFITTKPEIALLGAWVIIMPLAIIVKIKLDKITNKYNANFKTTKYKQNFKKYQMLKSEQLKTSRSASKF